MGKAMSVALNSILSIVASSPPSGFADSNSNGSDPKFLFPKQSRILNFGTAYQTDAGMCGDYDSVIGMNKENSLKRFLKEDSKKHFPAEGTASLSGVIVDCDKETGLAKNVESFIYGGDLKNTH